MASANVFQYDHELASDEIRLLHLHVGSRTEPISTSLLYKNQKDVDIQYHALSYVWGSPLNPVKITCDGQPLLITQNLHKALIQLRDNEVTDPIWIDAICIDQSNLDERTRQVRMMRQIYSQAEMVHIWLGEATADTERGVHFIHSLAEMVEKNLISDPSYSSFNESDVPPDNDPAWKPAADILSRQWFERMWVIQERTVARACVYLCGPYKISSDTLNSLTKNHQFVWELQHSLLANKPQNIDGTMVYLGFLSPFMARFHTDKGLTLGEWLCWTSGHKATDPRDRIFALIGLTTDTPTTFIDYRKDLRQVLIDVGVWLMTRGSRGFGSPLNVPSFVNHGHRSFELPSWVPEWKYANDSFFALDLIMPPKETIDFGEPTYTVEAADDLKLTIRGRIIDKVLTVIESPPMYGPNDPVSKTCFDFQPQIQAWHETVEGLVLSLGSYPSDMDLNEALWRAMCFNGGAEEPAPATYSHAYEAWKRVQVVTGTLGSMSMGGVDPVEMHQLVASLERDLKTAGPLEMMLSRYQASRSFCITEKGYIGWVSIAAREGDLVVAFWGTRLLYTLRPMEGGYRFTGDCYLQELMEGEALRTNEFTDEDIVIV